MRAPQDDGVDSTSIHPALDLKRPDLGQALLGELHASRAVVLLANVEVEGEHGLLAALLHPADQPADTGADTAALGLVVDADQAALGADGGLAHLGDGQDVPRQLLGPPGGRQRIPPQPVDEIDLLHRIDAQIAGEPEAIDAAADVVIAVIERGEILLHPLFTDPPCDFLIDRHGGSRDGGAQGVIPVPFGNETLDAIPLEDILVGIADNTRVQRNHRIRNLEGRRRQHRFAGPILVAGDHGVVVDLVGDERSLGAVVGKMLRQAVLDDVLHRRDGGARRGAHAGGSKQAERQTQGVTAGDQGDFRMV